MLVFINNYTTYMHIVLTISKVVIFVNNLGNYTIY